MCTADIVMEAQERNNGHACSPLIPTSIFHCFRRLAFKYITWHILGYC